MKAVMVGSSPAAAFVVVGTPIDEHKHATESADCEVLNDSENGAAFFFVTDILLVRELKRLPW